MSPFGTKSRHAQLPIMKDSHFLSSALLSCHAAHWYTGINQPSSHSSVGIWVQGTDTPADTLAAATDVGTKPSYVSDLEVLWFLKVK